MALWPAIVVGLCTLGVVAIRNQPEALGPEDTEKFPEGIQVLYWFVCFHLTFSLHSFG